MSTDFVPVLEVGLRIEDMPMPLVAESFRQWFERAPWLEVAHCPRCSPPLDFGSTGRYASFDPGICPVCGTILEPYWSDERVVAYVIDAFGRSGFHGYSYRESGRIVAWAWGYGIESRGELSDLPARGLYVDTFGFAEPRYRPHFLRFWDEAHADTTTRGVRYHVTRTHQDARYVQEALMHYGYRYLRNSVAEPDRLYMIKGL